MRSQTTSYSIAVSVGARCTASRMPIQRHRECGIIGLLVQTRALHDHMNRRLVRKLPEDALDEPGGDATDEIVAVQSCGGSRACAAIMEYASCAGLSSSPLSNSAANHSSPIGPEGAASGISGGLAPAQP